MNGSLLAQTVISGALVSACVLVFLLRFSRRRSRWPQVVAGVVFLDQASAQKDARRLHVEDGWTYFIHGWTRVIAEVFHIDIPTSGPEFEELSGIAARARRAA